MRNQRARRSVLGAALIFVVGFLLAGCSEQVLPAAEPGAGRLGQATQLDRFIVIDAAGDATPIDPRLLGTNLPAWAGPEVLNDADFQQGALDSGTTLVRMPGGSWSNVYDWIGCEQADAETCFWTWAARPTDFVDFLAATDLEGMWTVSINDTAQKSAAAVAFFNGDVDDATQIGVDRLGVDWGQVSDWAQLRARNGNPDPANIRLWEVGNEVYGGKPSNGGAQCASFGWEEVWTCDGAEYVEGTAEHDGALAIRQAMLDVDPDIEVGLVGVSDPDGWSNWGTEVIDTAGDSLDLYAVHHYGFDRSPTPEQALRRPAETWPRVIDQSRAGLPAGATLAITEFNLVAIESGDTEQTMTRAMNAFYLANSIGELAIGEVAIANWWNLANGVTQSGTDYGLVSLSDGEDYRRSPAFEAFALWGRAGTALLDVPDQVDELRVYPTRHDDGRVSILLVNRSARDITADMVIEGLDSAAGFEATLETFTAEDLNAQELTVEPVVSLGSAMQPFAVEIPAWSLSLLGAGPSS